MWCPGEPLEETLGVCADFTKMLLPDPMLRLRTGFRRPAGCQRAFVSWKELVVRLYETDGDHHHFVARCVGLLTTPRAATRHRRPRQ
jgi:hypothetical protein